MFAVETPKAIIVALNVTASSGKIFDCFFVVRIPKIDKPGYGTVVCCRPFPRKKYF